MPQPKTTLLVLFGGRSPEHDVSVISGLQVLEALDPALYDTIPLYIAPDGTWLTGEALRKRQTYIPGPEQRKTLLPVTLHLGSNGRPRLVARDWSRWTKPKVIEFDVALPVFHGLIGEDGPIQGLFEVANVPYAGMRMLSTALLMDKLATKRMIASTSIPQLPYWEIKRPKEGLMILAEELAAQHGNIPFPCCIKPAHLGSSIGVARVKDWQEVSDTLPGIFRFDDTAILEPFVENLVEYNVAVSRVQGEIRTSALERPKSSSELLDFKAKYGSGGTKGAKTGGAKSGDSGSEGMLSLTRDINPALPPDMEAKIRAWAADVFALVGGTGAPRLDFLCNGVTGELWFNEANPIPGSYAYFLWEAAKQPLLFAELLDGLIAEALALHAGRQLPQDPTPEAARLLPRR